MLLYYKLQGNVVITCRLFINEQSKMQISQIEDIFTGIIVFLSIYVYIHLKFRCYKNI